MVLTTPVLFNNYDSKVVFRTVFPDINLKRIENVRQEEYSAIIIPDDKLLTFEKYFIVKGNKVILK